MTESFEHRALQLQEKKPIIFTALSKKYFYMRMLIVKYVLEQGAVPLNPFMAFDYFLTDAVDRDLIRTANNNLVHLADELWVFGSISNGVLAEIKQTHATGKPVHYFAIIDDQKIARIPKTEAIFEDGMEQFRDELRDT